MSKSVAPYLIAMGLVGALALATYKTGVATGKASADQEWNDKWMARDYADELAAAKQDSDNQKREGELKDFYESQIKKAKTENEKTRLDYIAARDASKRLQSAIAEITHSLKERAPGKQSATAGKRQAEPDAGALLTIVLAELDAAAGEYAREADEAIKRGIQCEDFYGEVTRGNFEDSNLRGK